MKIKLKELFRKKEDDLDLDLDEELNDPDIRIETYEMTEDPQAKEELWDKIKKHQKFVHNRNAITMGLLFILLFGLGTFLFFHTGSTYLTSLIPILTTSSAPSKTTLSNRPSLFSSVISHSAETTETISILSPVTEYLSTENPPFVMSEDERVKDSPLIGFTCISTVCFLPLLKS